MSERKYRMTQTREQSSTVWRKSSHSGYNGECIEVATWRKSSHSGSNGAYIEVAATTCDNTAPEVAVRDSRDPAGPRLSFHPSAWRAFAAALRPGR
jgi:hypothetical protein